MWSIIGVIVALALFAQLSLIYLGRSQAAVREAALKTAAESAAASLATFARAGRSYAQANNSSNGTTITVSTLTGAGLLPSGFPSGNDLGQTLEAKVGATPSTLVAYWKGTASVSRFGIDGGVGAGYRSVQMRIAQAAVAPLATVPGVLSGVASGASVADAAPYARLLIPGATSGMTVNVSGFSVADQNALIYLP